MFSKLAHRGLLRIDDPLIAAEQFNWLALIPLNRAVFILDPIEPRDLHRAADRAVEMFLSAYGTGTCSGNRLQGRKGDEGAN